MTRALWHGHHARYELRAYAVMPNHVHVLFVLFRGHELAKVMHSLKSYTANRINALVGRTGTLWQREYWDRIVRDMRDYEETMAYIVNNPCKAGLRDWPWVWPRLKAAAPAG
jgi:REP element-mobilizing transposase RayT